MILCKIDAQRIAIFPLECDAPRTVDVHTVTLTGSRSFGAMWEDGDALWVDLEQYH